MKLGITYICTSKYNTFFKDFYESFNDAFCPGNKLTFVIITDQPDTYKDYKNVKIYDVQRYYKGKDVNYIKFRKWKDILLAEDFLETQDYCFYMNSNIRCNQMVTLEDLFKDKDQYAVYHSLFDRSNMPMYTSLVEHKQSGAYFAAKDKASYPNYKYYQAGNIGATSKKFLKMCYFIESIRQYDLFYGLDKYVPWHDENYYNKYINLLTKKDANAINILDGKKYLCSWLPILKSYHKDAKMIIINKDEVWQNLNKEKGN